MSTACWCRPPRLRRLDHERRLDRRCNLRHLTIGVSLYVMVDDFCHSRAPKMRPGPEASLCASEVITLAIFARWSRFASERDFYRYAQTKLRSAFPTLPDRSQFNRCVRLHTGGVVALPLGARRDFIE